MKKLTKKSGSFKIIGTIYPFDIYVCWGKPIEYFKDEIENIFGDEAERILKLDYKLGKSIMTPSKKSLMWLKTLDQTPESIAILSHEAFHCANHILDTCGFTLSEDSDEAWAYYIHYIVETVLKEINKS